MKTRVFWMVALALALGAPAFAQIAGEASVPRMPLPEFKKALDGGQVLVLDVRDDSSYAAGHIPGAVSYPLSDVEKRVAEVKSARKAIVTYCA